MSLSDSEIEALLSKVQTGGEELSDAAVVTKDRSAPKVKAYDFRRPDRFSKDQIRTLEMVHDGFARLLGGSLSTYLRMIVAIKSLGVRQTTYEEYIGSLPNPTSINIFTLEPLKGTAILELNPALIFALFDRILGGPGAAPTTVRELSDIEQSVVEKIIIRALDNLQLAWRNVVAFVPKLVAKESNPMFIQIAASNATAAIVTFEVKLKESTGQMTICLPYALLETVIYKLSAQQWLTVSQRTTSVEAEGKLRDRLKETSAPLKAVLGRAKISVAEFLRLKPGDIIPLDTTTDSALEVLVENRPKFLARPGLVSKRKAIQIDTVFSDGEEEAHGRP